MVLFDSRTMIKKLWIFAWVVATTEIIQNAMMMGDDDGDETRDV